MGSSGRLKCPSLLTFPALRHAVAAYPSISDMISQRGERRKGPGGDIRDGGFKVSLPAKFRFRATKTLARRVGSKCDKAKPERTELAEEAPQIRSHAFAAAKPARPVQSAVSLERCRSLKRWPRFPGQGPSRLKCVGRFLRIFMLSELSRRGPDVH
jgi:hypothetical protein